MLGADSTTSVFVSGAGQVTGYHYFNHNQKIFEIGQDSRFGIITWGLGGIPGISHRTCVAELSDQLSKKPPVTVEDVAKEWAGLFWPRYSAFILTIAQLAALKAKAPFDPLSAKPDPAARTKDEEDEFQQLKLNLVVGFCIAGYCLPSREPAAYHIIFDPMNAVAPAPIAIALGTWAFWGAPNMIQRLILGRDGALKTDLIGSGKWVGTDAELETLLNKYQLIPPAILPIRDAIDFVHSCIHSTIKAMKFSSLPQICGGPIELAVITTDRHFRWVRHKPFDTAMAHGE